MPDLPLHLRALLYAKTRSGLSFAEIASQIEKPEVWTAAVFYGQARMDTATAERLLKVLNVNETNEPVQTSAATSADPTQYVHVRQLVEELSGKGSTSMGVEGMVIRGENWDGPPKDPVLYRFYEALMVYGMSYKAIIQEKFGDGIMSAIDFRTSVERKADPKGDRVVITWDGKFLSYSPTDVW